MVCVHEGSTRIWDVGYAAFYSWFQISLSPEEYHRRFIQHNPTNSRLRLLVLNSHKPQGRLHKQIVTTCRQGVYLAVSKQMTSANNFKAPTSRFNQSRCTAICSETLSARASFPHHPKPCRSGSPHHPLAKKKNQLHFSNEYIKPPPPLVIRKKTPYPPFISFPSSLSPH